MALPIGGKVILDTNVFIDYLRIGRYAEWVFGGVGEIIRFLSAVVMMELRLGANTRKRTKAVDQILAAFPSGRLIAPAPYLYDRAGQLFRTLYGNAAGRTDRLAPLNDLLIALTAREIGATLVTNNLEEFHRISTRVRGLAVVAPTIMSSSGEDS